jgi:hypothetical protein
MDLVHKNNNIECKNQACKMGKETKGKETNEEIKG